MQRTKEEEMFETSIVSQQNAQPARRVRLFTVSLIAHTAVIFGTVAVSIASVDFPAQAPDEYRTAPQFAVSLPPPLGDPNGGARPQPKPAQPAQTPPPQANQVTAPPAIPDEVTPAEPSTIASTGSGDATGESDGPGLVEGPVGVPWGDPNSVATDLTAPPSVPTVPQVEERIYQASEVKAPVILRKVEPRYPSSMSRVGMAATVMVRCIIDKNGNVRDPQVIVSSMPPFNASVLEAIKQWKFTPGTLRGQPVETYLDLNVRFEVKR
jgi:protein TonB